MAAAGPEANAAWRNQVRGRHGRGVAAQRQVRQVQQPLHFEVVGLARQVLLEILHGLTRRRRLPKRRTCARGRREQTEVARRAIDAVVELGLVPVGQAERLEQPRQRVGYPFGESPRALPPFDRRIHVAQIGVQLRPGVLGIHRVDPLVARQRRRIDGAAPLGGPGLQALDHRRNRFASDLADTLQVLLPAGRFRHRQQDGVRLGEAADTEAGVDDARGAGGQPLERAGARSAGRLGRRHDFQNRVTGRQANDRRQLLPGGRRPARSAARDGAPPGRPRPASRRRGPSARWTVRPRASRSRPPRAAARECARPHRPWTRRSSAGQSPARADSGTRVSRRQSPRLWPHRGRRRTPRARVGSSGRPIFRCLPRCVNHRVD